MVQIARRVEEIASRANETTGIRKKTESEICQVPTTWAVDERLQNAQNTEVSPGGEETAG